MPKTNKLNLQQIIYTLKQMTDYSQHSLITDVADTQSILDIPATPGFEVGLASSQKIRYRYRIHWETL